MLVRLGQVAGGESLGELLLACHARIRRFTALAVALAEPAAAARSPAEVADGADAVRRYLELALPLHAADEDESLAPRLVARVPATAAALARMAAEHDHHRPLLTVVIDLCRALAAEPARLPALAPALAPAARALAAELLAHLEAEERDLFPHLSALPAGEQAAIVAELRARRA